MGMTSVKFHRMGASCSAGRRDGGVLGRDAVRVLELSACPHPSPPRPPGTTRDRKRRLSSVASGQGHHQLCLCSKASIKAPKDKFLSLFGELPHWGTRMLLCATLASRFRRTEASLFRTLLCVSLHLVHILISFVINWYSDE